MQFAIGRSCSTLQADSSRYLATFQIWNFSLSLAPSLLAAIGGKAAILGSCSKRRSLTRLGHDELFKACLVLLVPLLIVKIYFAVA
jgi:hypothetical protein